MRRFCLIYAVVTAFQLGQLSKTNMNAVVGQEWGLTFTLYFWITGSLLLGGLVVFLWRQSSQS